MTKKQKLELSRVGMETWPKLEPCFLLEDPAESYYAKRRLASADLFDNRLIFGDKPWRYVLIPHHGIAENITLGGLARRFGA